MNTPTGFFVTNPSRRTFVLYRGAVACEMVGTFATKGAAVARARELRREYLAEADEAVFAVVSSDARADSQAIFEEFRYMLHPSYISAA